MSDPIKAKLNTITTELETLSAMAVVYNCSHATISAINYAKDVVKHTSLLIAKSDIKK